MFSREQIQITKIQENVMKFQELLSAVGKISPGNVRFDVDGEGTITMTVKEIFSVSFRDLAIR